MLKIWKGYENIDIADKSSSDSPGRQYVLNNLCDENIQKQ